MPQAPAFSRLQLAAALLEYDNDLVGTPTRAQDSAIFAHLRRNPAAPPQSSRRSDYLHVSLPNESGSLGGRESALDSRRSRASRGSLDALRNPFGHDDHWSDEEEGNVEELEVDLASWGLDALIPKDKGKSAKGKARASTLPPPPVSSVRSHIPLTNSASTAAAAPRRAINTSRSVSLGGIAEHPDLRSEFLEAASKRRRSFGSPLDLADMELSQLPLQRPRSLSYSALRPPSTALQSVPFPSSSGRSPSPTDDRRISAGSQFVNRRLSRASVDSKLLLQEELTSGVAELTSDNPFTLRPPSPSRLSRFDPKATSHVRTISNISRGSRMLPDQVADAPADSSQGQPQRERKYSTTLELLRPKVLVMPSPLQQTAPATAPPQHQVRDGFLLSTDGPPLPPGARSAGRNSMMNALDSANKLPVASNSFTPNPLMNLSLSQMTFRNTLHIGGARDPYSDVAGGLPTAREEGEQVEFDVSEAQNDNELHVSGSSNAGPGNTRPPGKLFGKSLIDDLETRKTQMRSKQRVFTGDQRPSMMSRAQTQSTLIDPSTLNSRPITQRQSSFGIADSRQALSRKNSLNAKPLLNFDDEQTKFKPLTPATRMVNSRSVFGVDTLWEREMVKLREMEAEEAEKKRIEQEEQQEKKKSKKGKKKKKGQDQVNSHPEDERVDGSRVSIDPPILPDVQRATRPPPKAAEQESDEDQSDNDDPEPVTNATTGDTGNWFSDSDEEMPRRTTGVGPRYPNKSQQVLRAEDADSDEDMPLSAAVNRAIQRQRATRLQPVDDSDEEMPLSTLLRKAKQTPTAPSAPSINFDNLASRKEDDEDDDNKPLGLRASTMMNRSPQNGDDDDDRPLAFHPQQQKRTQYQMMAQQQQQMMMQAQFHNSMFFSQPSMLGSGFFGPPVMPPMLMQPSIPMPSPPPADDSAKFGRVDKWRHDVAVEGGQ